MESIGQYLKNERELRQLSLEEIAQATRIPMSTLTHLESDSLDIMPGDVFACGFLRLYAKVLNVDPDPLVYRYRRERRSEPENTTSKFPLGVRARRSKLGVGIALVILGILFTLAFAVVLSPRHRMNTVELSQQSAAITGGSIA